MESTKLIIAPKAEILVVDDNGLNLKVACGLLGLSKIKAKTASSGKDAIATVLQNKFDLVFMDHKMPDMDGIETVAHIRNFGHDYESIPIVALTANAVQGADKTFLSKGFNDFISKPIDLQKLNKILQQWLPPDKIAGELMEQSIESSGAAGLMNAIARLSGIDVQVGLSRVSDQEDMYIENLEFFYDELLSRRDAMADYLSSKNLSRFSIDAHSIKSVLATIGALQLSDIAAKLEVAGNNNDTDLCLNIFPAFHEGLTSLYKDLSDAFSSEKDASSGESGKGNAEYLLEDIRKAISAADDSNSELGLEILNLLLAHDFDEQITALLNEAFAAFDDFSYDQAKEVLEKVLEKV